MNMWERQLQVMIEHDHLDAETLSDLAVAYAAETGDSSLFGVPVVAAAPLFFVYVLAMGYGSLNLASSWSQTSRSCSYGRQRFSGECCSSSTSSVVRRNWSASSSRCMAYFDSKSESLFQMTSPELVLNSRSRSESVSGQTSASLSSIARVSESEA
jgi:hypothetical protein